MRPRSRLHRRRGRLAAAFALISAAWLTFASSAWAGFFTPESGGSPNANQINSLYKIIFWIAVFVFLVVEAALLYSVIRFRARKGREAAQIHGNTRLELSWTIAAALILVVLTVVTFVKLSAITDPPNSDAGGLRVDRGVLAASTTVPNPPNGNKLVICVTGRQYIWRFTYGAGCRSNPFGAKAPYSYTEMWAPANTTVVLAIQSNDVAHSWWVPKLGGKFDAIPGYTNYTWFKAPRAGVVYRGQCAELCGRNHAEMVAQVRIVTPAQYREWLAYQSRAINSANQQAEQLRQQLAAQGNL